MGILKELLRSKKIVMTVVGLLLNLLAPTLAQHGVVVDTETVTALIAAYLLGQGAADFGKNKVAPVVPVAAWKVDPCSPDKMPVPPL